MKKLSIILIIALPLLFFTGFKGTEKGTGIVADQIKWYTFQEAYILNKSNPKKIFIDVYTDWCGWCKKMDAYTFKDPQVIALMNKYFYAVKLNAEMSDTIVIDSVKYINPNPGAMRSTHQLAAALLNNKMSYPTTVYLNEKLAMLSEPIPGYQTPESIEPILVYLGEEIFANQTWEDFLKTYSPLKKEK